MSGVIGKKLDKLTWPDKKLLIMLVLGKDLFVLVQLV
jgi:hypothetical protein